MPDLRDMVKGLVPTSNLRSALMNAMAQGALRVGFNVSEGTPGLLKIVQANLLNTGKGIPGKDYWPVELVVVGVRGMTQ